jgi:MFS family permease
VPGYSGSPYSGAAYQDYYGAPAPEQAYPVAPYQYGYSPYGPPQRPTDGLAIASLIVSCLSVLTLCGYGVGGLIGAVGAILGHVARRRIRQSGAQGDGLALAGVIVGWITTAIGLLAVAFIVVFFATNEFHSGD